MQSDKFHFGRRQIIHYDKTGQPSYQWLPLDAADFLDPQEGDEFNNGARHENLASALRRLFRYLHRYNPSTLVISGVKLVWGVDDLPQPAPDLAVIPNVASPEQPRSRFDVAAEGTAPRFVLDVTSPRLASLDHSEKRRIYEQAGVEEYFVLDTGETDDAPCRLAGYRLAGDRYEPLAADERGYLYSATNRAWLGINPNRQEPVLIDDRTGEPVIPPTDVDESPAAKAAAAEARASSIAAQLDFLRPND